MNDLQVLVTARMRDLGLSYRSAAARAKGKVSHATLNSIVTGRHSWRLDDRTIEGIALALDVGVPAVRAACQQPEPVLTEFVLPDRASRLNPRERRVILGMIDALLAKPDAMIDGQANGQGPPGSDDHA